MNADTCCRGEPYHRFLQGHPFHDFAFEPRKTRSFSSHSLTTQEPACGQQPLLPADVLNTILLFVCTDSNDDTSNQTLLNFRCCSKALTTACDATRRSITLHPHQFPHALPYLCKLTSLTALTLRALPHSATAPESHSNVLEDLSLISNTFPNLESLTFGTAAGSGGWELHCMDEMLPPWRHSLRHSLRHLELQRCLLAVMPEDGGDCVNQTEWAPDLPQLTSLVLTQSLCMDADPSLNQAGPDSMALDLLGCPQLRELTLKDCTDVAALCVAGLAHRNGVSVSGTDSLLALDLSSCVHLASLECAVSELLEALVLDGCSALQRLDFQSNVSVRRLALSDCVSLVQAKVMYNDALQSVDLTGCGMLPRVECSSNKLLNSLKLPRGGGCLEEVDCTCNPHLTDLDLTGFQALRSLECGDNDALTSLGVARCSSLVELSCRGCKNLPGLDLSGCTALRHIDCTGSGSLVRLRHLADCHDLTMIARKGCGQLEMAYLVSFIAATGYWWHDSASGCFLIMKPHSASAEEKFVAGPCRHELLSSSCRSCMLKLDYFNERLVKLPEGM